jgi:subtilisin family serine protease
MRHRGKTSARLSARTAQRSLRLEQLEVRQMLAGNVAAGIVSANWFGSYAAADQPLHAAAPSITASDTSTQSGAQSGSGASSQLDWIVQFNTAAASGISGAAGAAILMPQSGPEFQILEGLGAVGEVLVRSYDATSAQARAALQSDRQIAWFEADSLKQIDAAVPNDAQFSQQWALDNTGQTGGTAGCDIDATQAWNITTGSRNVVVAVIDSGVDYTDPDLAANIWTNPNAGQDGFSGDVHGYNFVGNTGDPMDDNGHGTFVAGEIGAVGDNGQGVAGVNWNVTIMPLKFLNANGGGYTSDAIRAINYTTMERTEYGVNVRVINASWCSSQSDAGLSAAIAAAGNAGILFVAAAGNSASNNDVTPQYPANAGTANVVSVAASDSNDQLASFSDYGASTVNLAAPGVNIYGTLPGGKYGYLSGTSMATPEVTGVAALAWAADPNATVAQVRSALLQGVTRVPALAGKVSSGGCLNAYNTLEILAAPAPAPSPSPSPTPGPRSVAVPAIASLVTSANSVPAGSSVSLVAQGVSADGGTIAGILFYLDSSGNGQWNASDTVIGTTSSISGGQSTISLSTGNLTAGSYRVFARVLDTDGQWSSAVSTQLTVTTQVAPGTNGTNGTNATTAVAVAIGSTAQGDIISASQTDYFKVQVVAGQKYTFQVVLGSLYDSVLTLLGTNGQAVIAQNDGMASSNRASCIRWQATGSGTYYLAVGSYPGSPVGSFTLATTGPAASTPASTSKATAAPAAASLEPSGRQLARSVAIPSATLRSAAAAVVLSSNFFGAAAGSVSNSPWGLDPAALDTLLSAYGR